MRTIITPTRIIGTDPMLCYAMLCYAMLSVGLFECERLQKQINNYKNDLSITITVIIITNKIKQHNGPRGGRTNDDMVLIIVTHRRCRCDCPRHTQHTEHTQHTQHTQPTQHARHTQHATHTAHTQHTTHKTHTEHTTHTTHTRTHTWWLTSRFSWAR